MRTFCREYWSLPPANQIIGISGIKFLAKNVAFYIYILYFNINSQIRNKIRTIMKCRRAPRIPLLDSKLFFTSRIPYFVLFSLNYNVLFWENISAQFRLFLPCIYWRKKSGLIEKMETATKTKCTNLYFNTPLLESTCLSKRLGYNVYLKLENTQPTGSFKIRGIGNCCKKVRNFWNKYFKFTPRI